MLTERKKKRMYRTQDKGKTLTQGKQKTRAETLGRPIPITQGVGLRSLSLKSCLLSCSFLLNKAMVL